MTVRMLSRALALACAPLVAVAVSAGTSTGSASAPVDRSTTAPPPVVTPTPQQLTSLGTPVPVTQRVAVVVDDDTDQPALGALVTTLKAHGVTRIDQVRPGAHTPPGLLVIHLGAADRPDVAAAVTGTPVPAYAEAYGVRVGQAGPSKTIGIAGHDGAGQFYGVQTVRQLLSGRAQTLKASRVSVSDHPSMPLRGTIEGFYGPPWTPAERLDQMDFYGQVKANTYVYAPKDDPYHRDQWRTPYPADKLTELGTLVKRATANHVQFTFAVSPGGSICYSSKTDRDQLKTKLQSMYDLGVRSFSIPLDDISYTRWNCAEDEAAYGAPGRQSAAKAQVSLLNDVQQQWISTHDDARPLQMVPTEYGDLTDTAYKQEMRATLDPAVVVMWTGTDVVPPAVTNDQADQVQQLFGRKVFLWDNYPVNDFTNTKGRLLLAPYDKREAGLSNHLSGIVANPMNQPYASKIAVLGAADFAWNDTGYDAQRGQLQALLHLAGGDTKATAALSVFTDLEHLAPTFGATPWQPQAPELARRVAAFWTSVKAGHTAEAITALRPYAARIAGAPAAIRAGAVQSGFVADAKPWLDATGLWGQAMVLQLDAVAARLGGDEARAAELTRQSKALQVKAAAVKVDPVRNSWGAGPVKVGDGVLDTFLTDAGALASP